MIKAVIAFLVILLVELIALSGLGLYAMYELSGEIGLYTSLSVFVVTILVTALLVWRLIELIKSELTSVINSLKQWLASLSIKDIVKIILGLLKK